VARRPGPVSLASLMGPPVRQFDGTTWGVFGGGVEMMACVAGRVKGFVVGVVSGVIGYWSSRSETATGSEQWGHSPPRPILRVKVPQSGQRCSPRARLPQLSHS
jgi:hypothetical protein